MWGVFQDIHGILHCELINYGIECWTRQRPARPEKRNLLGKIIRPAQEASEDFKAVLLEEHYSRKDYVGTAFECPLEEAGYTLQSMRRYLKPNYWGAVQIILVIEDDKTGQMLQDRLNKFAPADPKNGPRPENDFILRMMRDLGEM